MWWKMCIFKRNVRKKNYCVACTFLQTPGHLNNHQRLQPYKCRIIVHSPIFITKVKGFRFFFNIERVHNVNVKAAKSTKIHMQI